MKLLSISKIFRKFSEITDPYPRVRGTCALCGKCCKSLMLTYRKKVVTTMDQYNRLLSWDREVYSRFVPDEQQTPGSPMRFSCIYQNKENHCTVHTTRPDICRTYPHHSIFKLGAELEDECGYRLVRKGSFEDILDQKRK